MNIETYFVLWQNIITKKSADAENPFCCLQYLLENGVGSDYIVEIALDGIENEELRDPKMRFWFPMQAVTTLREGFAWKEITGRY